MRTATKTTLNPAQLDQLSIKTIRFLSVAQCKRPIADIRACPWVPRPSPMSCGQRFSGTIRSVRNGPIGTVVLSAGHVDAAIQLAALTGYNLPLDQIKEFRQWGSS